MTDIAGSTGKKKSGVDTILGANAITNAAEALTASGMTGEKKKKKANTIVGTLGGGAAPLGGE